MDDDFMNLYFVPGIHERYEKLRDDLEELQSDGIHCKYAALRGKVMIKAFREAATRPSLPPPVDLPRAYAPIIPPPLAMSASLPTQSRPDDREFNRCGRAHHTAPYCWQTRHINGSMLPDSPPAEKPGSLAVAFALPREHARTPSSPSRRCCMASSPLVLSQASLQSWSCLAIISSAWLTPPPTIISSESLSLPVCDGFDAPSPIVVVPSPTEPPRGRRGHSVSAGHDGFDELLDVMDRTCAGGEGAECATYAGCGDCGYLHDTMHGRVEWRRWSGWARRST